MRKDKSGEYEVGYGRPPKNTRFGKGQSGNPSGRIKGIRNLRTELSEELAEAIQIREQGKAKKITKQRALIKALTANAVQGDARAANLIINMVFKLLHPDLLPESATPLPEEDLAIVEAFLERRRVEDSGEDKR